MLLHLLKRNHRFTGLPGAGDVFRAVEVAPTPRFWRLPIVHASTPSECWSYRTSPHDVVMPPVTPGSYPFPHEVVGPRMRYTFDVGESGVGRGLRRYQRQKVRLRYCYRFQLAQPCPRPVFVTISDIPVVSSVLDDAPQHPTGIEGAEAAGPGNRRMELESFGRAYYQSRRCDKRLCAS